MKKHLSQELPIRAKLEMAQDVAEVIVCLGHGRQLEAEKLLQDLKARALYFDESVQQNVLVFAEQVQFQLAYDPSVTHEVQRAANLLLESLGWVAPPNENF